MIRLRVPKGVGMVATIASAAAQPRHRLFAAVLAFLLILAALAAWLAGAVSLPALPSFQPMIAAAVLLCGAITAYLLCGQFLVSRVRGLLWPVGTALAVALVAVLAMSA